MTPTAPVAPATTPQHPTPRELFDAHLALARTFANAFARRMPRAITADELHAAALTGLWNAAQTHAAKARGKAFHTHAYLCCRRAMIDWLRQSRPLFWHHSRYRRCRKQMVWSGRGLPVMADPRSERERERAELRDEAEGALKKLQVRERRLLRAYYLEGLSMREIGARLGTSESYVSILLSQFTRRGGRPKRCRLPVRQTTEETTS